MNNYADFLPLSEGAVSKVSKSQKNAIRSFLRKIEDGTYNTEEFACLCGSESDLLIATHDRYRIPVQTVGCADCGLIRSSSNLDEDSLAQFYSEDYRNIYGPSNKKLERHLKNQISSGDEIFNFLVGHIQIDSGTAVLDVGCGAGGVLGAFDKCGAQTEGYDYCSEYVLFGKSRGHNVFHIDEYNSTRKVDVIILSHVLEHLRDPISELSNLSERLNEGGVIYIGVPGLKSINDQYGSLSFYLQNAHLWHFSLDTLTNVASASGLELIAGDEQVRSIFQKGKKQPLNKSEVFFQDILKYLTEHDLIK